MQAPNGTDLVVNQYDLFNGLTIESIIGNNGGTALTKTGPGMLTLSGPNSYAGVNNIWGGTVLVKNATALGVNATTAAVNMNPGTTLDLASGVTGLSTSYGVTLNGLIAIVSGVENILTPGSASYFTIQSGRTTVSGGVNQTLGVLTMKNPFATQCTDVLNVTKDPNVNDANASVTFSSINISDGANYLDRLVLNPTTANLIVAGAITDGGRPYLALEGTSTGSQIQGVIGIYENSAQAVTKLNTGTWTLLGANTYNANANAIGTTIGAGTLVFGGANGVLDTYPGAGGHVGQGLQFLGTTANLTFDNSIGGNATGVKNQSLGVLTIGNQVGGDDTLDRKSTRLNSSH